MRFVVFLALLQLRKHHAHRFLAATDLCRLGQTTPCHQAGRAAKTSDRRLATVMFCRIISRRLAFLSSTAAASPSKRPRPRLLFWLLAKPRRGDSGPAKI